MELLPSLLAFIAAAALLTVTPGLDNALVLRTAAVEGPRRAMLAGLGIALGCLTWGLIVALGLGVLLAASTVAYSALKWAGAAYLVWLGVKKWRRAGRLLETDATAPNSLVKEVGLGMAMTLSNPIALVFYVALLPGVIDVEGVTVRSYLILCAILVAVMVAVVLGYGLMAELARKLLSATDSKSRIDRISGVMFVLAGLLVAFR